MMLTKSITVSRRLNKQKAYKYHELCYYVVNIY